MADFVDGVPKPVLARLRKLCLALPETSLRSDRFAHAFRVRKRIFTQLLAPEDPSGRPVPMVVVTAEPLERAALVAIGHPYFAVGGRGGRVGVLIDASTDWEEMRELVTVSYLLLAPKKLAALVEPAQDRVL